MASFNLAERLAELLNLPIERAQAFGQQQGAPKEEPSYRLATLKDSAWKVTPPVTDENELYAQWRNASEEKKPEFEKPLFGRLVKHARAVIWQRSQECDADWENLANDIASAAIKNLSLGRFREGSKFSTYVQGIAKNKINEELERRTESRKRHHYFVEEPDEHVTLIDPRTEAPFERVEKSLDLERLVKELRGKNYILLQCQLDGMTMAQSAEKLGDSEDAAESRWRRLKTYLKERIRESSDGK